MASSLRGAARWLAGVATAGCVMTAVGGGYVPGCSEGEFRYALTGGGDVVFSQACTLSLTSTVEIAADTTVDAGGFAVTLNGGGKVRLFNVAEGRTLILRGLTLTGGFSTNGGAIYVGANASVVIEDCVFSANVARGENGAAGRDGSDSEIGNGEDGRDGKPGQAAYGGAIYSLGSLTVSGSSFLTNTATGGNGGAGGEGGDAGAGLWQSGSGGAGAPGAIAAGGAIYTLGSLVIEDTTFSQNAAVAGNGGAGGAAGEGTYTGLDGSGGKGADASGGAVYAGQALEIARSTFSDNAVRGGHGAAGGNQVTGNGSNGRDGGQASGGAIAAADQSQLVNCTLYNNRAVGGNGGQGGDARLVAGNGGDGGNGLGGAIYNLGALRALHCTIAQGGAYGGTNGVAGTGTFEGEAGSKGRARGGNVMNAGTSFRLQNTIAGPSLSGGVGYGTFVDEGGNLGADESLKLGNTSFSGVAPQLGGLGSYGGATPTVTLLAGSPAVNAALPVDGLAEDQRGSVRPDSPGGLPDIGAFEGQRPMITVNPASQTRPMFGTATFTVAAQGDPPLSYAWWFEGQPMSSRTNATLTLSNLNTNHAGSYVAVVSSAFGSVTSTPALLTLAYPPMIQQQPSNQTAVVGGTATFRVVATGSEPLTYQWRFNTNIVVATGTNAAFHMSNVQLTNAGVYSVTVTNLGGSQTSLFATLEVVTPPTLVISSVLSNQFVFGVSTVSNASYVLEYKELLTDPLWTPLSTNQGTGSMLMFSEPLTNGSGFYRVGYR